MLYESLDPEVTFERFRNIYTNREPESFSIHFGFTAKLNSLQVELRHKSKAKSWFKLTTTQVKAILIRDTNKSETNLQFDGF